MYYRKKNKQCRREEEIHGHVLAHPKEKKSPYFESIFPQTRFCQNLVSNNTMLNYEWDFLFLRTRY